MTEKIKNQMIIKVWEFIFFLKFFFFNGNKRILQFYFDLPVFLINTTDISGFFFYPVTRPMSIWLTQVFRLLPEKDI